MSRSLPIIQIPVPTPWPSVGPVHVYLIPQDPVTLIDTGVNDDLSREALLAGLKAAGLALKDIRRQLITHAHLDHMGLAAWIQAESNAEVWVHPDEVGKLDSPDWWLAGRELALSQAGVPQETRTLMDKYWRMGRRLALPLAEWKPLAEGQRFAFADGALTAIHLPGHALGHTGFFEESSGTLMGGDHLLMGVTPNPIMEPLPPGHPAGAPHAPGRALTLGMFLQALRRVSDMPVRRVLPGHGPVIDDHVRVAGTYAAKHERRLGMLKERIAGGATPFAITREVYPRVKEFDIFLALSEVQAHLDLLVARGQAAFEPEPKGWVYRAERGE